MDTCTCQTRLSPGKEDNGNWLDCDCKTSAEPGKPAKMNHVTVDLSKYLVLG
jgi:hypothetical protein